MKKVLVLFFLCLFIIPFVSPIEINMKSDYNKGETIIASVPGNFLEPLTTSNVYFYRKHLRTSFDYSLGKIGDNYYIYVQTDKTPDNYSIVLNNVRYLENGVAIRGNIVKNFTIKNSSADFSVNPGFVITEDDFYIEIQNFKQDKITVSINSKTIFGDAANSFAFSSGTTDISSSFDVNSLSKKRVNVLTEDISKTSIKYILFSSNNLKYEIPVYFIVQNIPQEETPSEVPECTKDGDCSGTDVCENEKCVSSSSSIECIIDWNCEENEVCENMKCVPESTNNEEQPADECITNLNCPDGKICENGKCIVKTTTTCTGLSTQSCTIVNGQGTRTRTCNSGTWGAPYGTCTVISCNSGYQISGNNCIAKTCTGSSTQSCTIANGVGARTRTCNNGVWGAPYGNCIIQSCNSGYQASGDVCVLTTCTGLSTQSCTITNGQGSQTRTCNSGTWSSYGNCIVKSCNSGYKISGNSCISSATPISGCLSDLDCKSGRVCRDKLCVEYSSSVVGCTTDTDCKGGRICKNKACIYQNSSSQVTTGCTTDNDCKGERICKNKACVYVTSINSSNNSSDNEDDLNSTEIKKCFLGLCGSGEVCINKTCVKNNTNTQINTTHNNSEDDEKDYEVIVKDNGDVVAVKDGRVTNGTASLKKCSELYGKSCASSEICNGESVYASDYYCCIGSCSKVKKSNVKLIGWIIIVVLFIIFILFVSNYNKSRKKQFSISELAKRRH